MMFSSEPCSLKTALHSDKSLKENLHDQFPSMDIIEAVDGAGDDYQVYTLQVYTLHYPPSPFNCSGFRSSSQS